MPNTVSFNCPACRKRLNVNRQLISKRLQCNRCNDIFYLKKVSREEFLAYELKFQPVDGVDPNDSSGSNISGNGVLQHDATEES